RRHTRLVSDWSSDVCSSDLILKKLNAEEGITIILVTHDDHVARHAQRIIRIKDGVIVEEEAPSAARAAAPPLENAASAPRAGIDWPAVKSAWRTLRIALRALR